MSGLRVCLENACPELTDRRSGYCDMHDARSSRNHFGVSRQARGYDATYEQDRAELLGGPCAMRLPGCTGIATTAQHTDDGRLIGACAHCNYADGTDRMRRRVGVALASDRAPQDRAAAVFSAVHVAETGNA